MQTKKPNIRLVYVSNMIELSPNLRRIVFTGESLSDFPVGFEGGYVKVLVDPKEKDKAKMRSYTIRTFNSEMMELTLDFVINCHEGPATNWALNAKIGDCIGIAGPGPMKMTDYKHNSYLLVGDLTSLNAINGYIPRFNDNAIVHAIITIPTRENIIEMDYDNSINTEWFIENESQGSFEDKVIATSRKMSLDTKVFMGLEAGLIRNFRAYFIDNIGLDRLNIFAVAYWKKGVDAEQFGKQKKAGLRI